MMFCPDARPGISSRTRPRPGRRATGTARPSPRRRLPRESARRSSCATVAPGVTARRGTSPAVTSSSTSSSRAAAGQVGGHHGVAVDQRLVVRRRVDVAGNVFGQHQSQRFARRHVRRLSSLGRGRARGSGLLRRESMHAHPLATGRGGLARGRRSPGNAPAASCPSASENFPDETASRTADACLWRMPMISRRPSGPSLQAQTMKSGCSVSGSITRL